MNNYIFILVILFHSRTLPAQATSYSQGIDHYLHLRYEAAFNSFLKAATNKHAEAYTLLAQLYLRGEFVPQNLNRADSLAQVAIKLGDKKGHYIRGMVKLEYGYPGQAEEHFVEAIPAIALAAKDNLFWAIRLGYCHSEGLGVAINNVLARELYANAGAIPNALHNLAVMNVQGKGGDQDLERGLVLYRAALAQGYQNSCPGIYDIAELYEQNGSTWERNEALSLSLYKECAACGNSYAYIKLAELAPDEKSKLAFYEKAAAAGNPEGALRLAKYYQQENVAKAKDYYEKAVAFEDQTGIAHLSLAKLYTAGANKIEKDEIRAQQHYYYALMKDTLPEAFSFPTHEEGDLAPYIDLPNAFNQSIKLSDYRGQYVFLDFWASWCGPCRAETPYILDVYKKYNAKQFVVFSVSIDRNKEAWQKAVIKDDMIWPNLIDNTGRVSLWYQFDGIPFNLLLDKEGRIIDGNLRGAELDQAVSRLMK